MTTVIRICATLFAALLLAGNTVAAQSNQPQISLQAKSAYDAIAAHPLVKKGLAFLEADDANTLDDQKKMTRRR